MPNFIALLPQLNPAISMETVHVSNICDTEECDMIATRIIFSTTISYIIIDDYVLSLQLKSVMYMTDMGRRGFRMVGVSYPHSQCVPFD